MCACVCFMKTRRTAEWVLSRNSPASVGQREARDTRRLPACAYACFRRRLRPNLSRHASPLTTATAVSRTPGRRTFTLSRAWPRLSAYRRPVLRWVTLTGTVCGGLISRDVAQLGCTPIAKRRCTSREVSYSDLIERASPMIHVIAHA